MPWIRSRDALPVRVLVVVSPHRQQRIDGDVQPMLRPDMQGFRPERGEGPLHRLEGVTGLGLQAGLDVIGEAGPAPDLVGDRLQLAPLVVAPKEKGPEAGP